MRTRVSGPAPTNAPSPTPINRVSRGTATVLGGVVIASVDNRSTEVPSLLRTPSELPE
ncbi:Uncharacterised protein [Mycobacteroides abscessus subsp. abscessus]|nr:Uncharacterised protein [Mycobacteroides abscessus subsp. abscessus]